MKLAVGRPGTLSSLLLRIGQSLFAATSIAFMVSAFAFSNYTAFCYLIASMGLQALWSFGLACLDFYAMWIKRDLRTAVLVSLFVVGDWVTATLSLAAACSSAGVAVLFARDVDYCRAFFPHACHKYEISIAFAFITWLLIAISSLVMLWLLASV